MPKVPAVAHSTEHVSAATRRGIVNKVRRILCNMPEDIPAGSIITIAVKTMPVDPVLPGGMAIYYEYVSHQEPPNTETSATTD